MEKKILISLSENHLIVCLILPTGESGSCVFERIIVDKAKNAAKVVKTALTTASTT